MDIFIKKINATVAVDWDALPASIQAQVIDYGLKQKLSDGLSEMSVAKGNTVEEMTFAVSEALAELYAGNWSARGRTADPVAKEAKAIAERRVAKAYKANKALFHAKMAAGGYAEDKYGLAKYLAAVVDGLLKNDPSIMQHARERIEAEGTETVDLDGLL